MDIMTDPSFWGQVGLTAAGRLAVLAAVIWVAKIVIAGAPSTTGSQTAVRPHVSSPGYGRDRRSGAEPAGSTAYFDLRFDSGPKLPAARDRNVLRDRLMDYLRERSAERSVS